MLFRASAESSCGDATKNHRTMTMIANRPLVALGLLGMTCAPAAGQTVEASGRTAYEAGYFSVFAPANALQIVERVPGFKLEIGETELRGLSQAAGNVVINGERPSSKSDTLDVILARIPASRVARVEVGPGALFGSESAGQPQVLNLVMTGDGGTAGTIEAAARRSYTGQLYPEGSASALLNRGFSIFNMAAGFSNHERTDDEGTDRLVEVPGNQFVEFRRKQNDAGDPSGFAAASWSYAGGAHRTAHLNARFAFGRLAVTQANDVSPAVGPPRNDLLTQRHRRREFEFSGDVTRPLLGGGLTLVGVTTRRHRLNRDEALNRNRSTVIGGLAQELDETRAETVLRLAWRRSDSAAWNVEAGAEGALNRLDSGADLFSLDASGARTRIDLPVDQALVKERRGEAFLNIGRKLAPTLRMDAGLTYETSRLAVSGDARTERSLGFFKPQTALDLRLNGSWRARLSVARTVAQLRFEDFIGGAELTNDRVNGGNAGLVPQRAWEWLAALERPILGDGRLRLELGYDRISHVQDRVPTPEGFDAPGNLGGGRRYSARFDLDAPLGDVGVTGGRLALSFSVADSSVVDPYTDDRRRFSGGMPWDAEVSFRQDLGKLAWGMSLAGNSGATVFRRNEVDRTFRQIPYVAAFTEFRATQQLTLTIGLENATDASTYRERRFFMPDRKVTRPGVLERRERNKHIVPYITLRRSFG